MNSLVATHPLKLLSVFVCLLLLVGVAYRRRRRIHIPLMLSAFAIDLSMVFYLEIRRGVVESIPSRPMTTLLFVHILISVLVLVLYGVQITTGIRNLRGPRRPWHRKAGMTFLLLRFGNLITSFFVTQ